MLPLPSLRAQPRRRSVPLVVTPAEARARARNVLLRLALTSETRARAVLSATSHAQPTSAPPTGVARPLAEVLALELEAAGDDVEGMGRVAERAREALEVILRRPLAEVRGETLEDLEAAVVDRGEGWDARSVAISLRTSERLVRRIRLARGLDEYGRRLELNGNGSRVEQGAELVAAGFSIRGAALVAGVPKSTLADGLRRGR